MIGFLGLDESYARRCPHCEGRDLLVYTSFSKVPVSCAVCVLMKKAKRAEPTWEDEGVSDEEFEKARSEQLAFMRANRSPLQNLLYGIVENGAGTNKRKIE